MSVTRALVTLKRMGDQIEAAISNGKFVAKTVGKNQFRKVIGTNDSVEAMTSKIQGSYDSVDALIEQRARIKSAIVMSNATTMVTVLGKEIPVAAAIELKSTVGFRTDYLNALRVQRSRELAEVDKANAQLDQAIETSLHLAYGSEKSKIDDATFKAIVNPQKEQKESSLLDPQKIDDKIAKLAQEILELSSELDFTLSESNARTIIDV